MDDARFDRYVREWTARAAHDLPAARRAAMRWATAALVVLPILTLVTGIVGITALVLGIFAIGAMPLAAFFIIAFGACLLSVSWKIGRSMFVRFTPPDGVRVSRSELPELWARVDRIAAAVGAEPPGVIVLERGFTAYAAWHAPSSMSVRATGWLGLGLATFAMFEPDELDSIIAHELSHMLHGDASSLRRTRRALVMWGKLHHAAMEFYWRAAQPGAGVPDRWTAALFRRTVGPFAQVMEPRLAGIERAIAREHELVADGVSAKVVSPEAAARALVRCDGRLHVWSAESTVAWNGAVLRGESPRGALAIETAMLAGLEYDDPRVRLSLAAALMRTDHWSDEHPALGRRLAMLGVGIDRPNRVVVTYEDAVGWARRPASGALWNDTFGSPSGSKVLERIAAGWMSEQRTHWQRAVDAARGDALEINALADRASREQLTAADYVRLALNARITHGRDASRSWLVWATHVDPGHARAAYMLGRSMVASGDATGIGWLQHAMALAPEFTGDAQLTIAAWHRGAGDVASAEATIRDRDVREQELSAARYTPGHVLDSAVIEDAPPRPREVAVIRAAATEVSEVIGAWCGRLRVPNPPIGRQPIAVIFQLRHGVSEQRAMELRASLHEALDAACFASRFDQWFVMVGIGPCPKETLGGRLEATWDCRVPGVGPAELADVRLAA